VEHDVSFLGDLGLVLVAASLASVIFRLLRLPTLLGYLVTGLAVGPYIPIPIFANLERVEALAEFGVVLVMFSVGLEFSLERLGEVLPKAGGGAVVQMSGLALCGFGFGRLVGFSAVESIFLGAALSVSSTMVVARVFDEQPIPKPLRQLVFGTLVVQDVVAVCLITVLTAIAAGSEVSGAELFEVLGSLLAVLVGMVAVGLLLVPRLMRLVVRLGSSEVLAVAALGLCFGFAVLARSFGYSVALGAFIAGMLVAESGEGHRVEGLVAPVRDLFSAVFFVSIGMLVDPMAALGSFHLALGIAGLVIVAQLVTVTFAGVLAGNGLRTSVGAGIYLGQIGEFSFIMVTIGTAAGVVEPQLLSILVTVAAMTTFTTPMLGRVAERIADGLDRRLPRRLQTALSLYERWFERLQLGGSPENRRLITVIALDAGVLVALAIGASVATGPGAELVSGWIGWSFSTVRTAIVVLAIAGAVPFGIGLLRSSRVLGRRIAGRVVGSGDQGAPDLGAAPRRLLEVAVQLLIVTVVGAPLVAMTVPFLPVGVGLVVFGVVLVGLIVGLWRDADELQGHVRASAELMIELLGEPNAQPPDLHGVESLLPGLDGIRAVRIGQSTPARGSTLAELNLRAATGATVLAIRRGEVGVVTPAGDERLEVGDLLALAGTAEAIERARALLAPEPSTSL